MSPRARIVIDVLRVAQLVALYRAAAALFRQGNLRTFHPITELAGEFLDEVGGDPRRALQRLADLPHRSDDGTPRGIYMATAWALQRCLLVDQPRLGDSPEPAEDGEPLKLCGCGRGYVDAHAWRHLAYGGAMRSDMGEPDLEFRHCTCGSTLAVQLEHRLDRLKRARAALAEVERRQGVTPADHDRLKQRPQQALGRAA